jgi:hypothetical protein
VSYGDSNFVNLMTFNVNLKIVIRSVYETHLISVTEFFIKISIVFGTENNCITVIIINIHKEEMRCFPFSHNTDTKKRIYLPYGRGTYTMMYKTSINV